MAEDITSKSPAEIREVTDALKEYQKVVKETFELEVERSAEQKSFYNALLTEYIESEKEARKRIEVLKDDIALDVATIERLKKAGEEANKLAIEQKRKEIEIAKARVKVLEETTKVNKQFQEELIDFVKEQKKALFDLTLAFDNFGDSILASAAKTVAAMQLLGMGRINLFKEAQKSIVPIDDARRDLIPFMATVDDANKLITEMGFRSERTAISITDQAHAAEQASKSFRMFSLESAESQASIALLAAQLDDLGVGDGGSIIESFISDMGLENRDLAENAIKSLTMEMKELGVTPQQLFSDFNKLIGTFAMFGEAGATNIAKVSAMAQKMRTDVGTITGFADQFSTFEGAAQAMHKINALFGMKVIDNAKELITTFYAQGQPGVAMLVRRKLEEKGVDMEQFFAGPAGAARAAFAGRNLGLGNAQGARRFFMTPIEELNLEGVGEGAAGPGGFDDFAKGTLTLNKQIEADAEKRATELLRLMGLQSLGQVGLVVDSLFAELSTKFSEKTAELAESPIMKSVRDSIADALGVGGEGTAATAAAVTPTGPLSTASGALSDVAITAEKAGSSFERGMQLLDEASKVLEKMILDIKGSTTGGAPGGNAFQTGQPFGFGTNPRLQIEFGRSLTSGIVKIVDERLTRGVGGVG